MDLILLQYTIVPAQPVLQVCHNHILILGRGMRFDKQQQIMPSSKCIYVLLVVHTDERWSSKLDSHEASALV